ncbi:type II toxin-antitoxin system VapC family toxin [Chitinophagaceae bacterium LWZ2-11]
MKQIFVLDACAIISFLSNEPGADIVESLLESAENGIVILMMHKATIAEVYYDTIKVSNVEQAQSVLKDILSYPIIFIDSVSDEMIKAIGYFKASYKISFADSFVLATSKLHNAQIVTSDHHEFDCIEKAGDVVCNWIR